KEERRRSHGRKMENLSLYGHPNESWELNLPADGAAATAPRHRHLRLREDDIARFSNWIVHEGLTDELGAEAMMKEYLPKYEENLELSIAKAQLDELKSDALEAMESQKKKFVLAEDLSPLPEADTGGVTVIESSTPIAETASSKTNSVLQPEDATTRACSIQYETYISLLGEDMSPPLPEADKDGGVIVTESSTPIAEAASSKTNNGSQTEDIQKADDESTKPVTLRFSRDCFFYKAWYVVVIYNATNQMS
ncbi:unnamed protein product, partial [Brassica oleracea var. botrytis]